VNLITIVWIIVFFSWFLLIALNLRTHSKDFAPRFWFVFSALFLSYSLLFIDHPLPVFPWEERGWNSQVLHQFKRISQSLNSRLSQLDREVYEPLKDLKKKLITTWKSPPEKGEWDKALKEFSLHDGVSLYLYNGRESLNTANWDFKPPDWSLQLAYSMALSRAAAEIKGPAPPLSKDLIQTTLKASIYHEEFLRKFFDRPNQLHSMPSLMWGRAASQALWTYFSTSPDQFWILVMVIDQEGWKRILTKKLSTVESTENELQDLSISIDDAGRLPLEESFLTDQGQYRFQTPVWGSNGLVLSLQTKGESLRVNQEKMEIYALLVLAVFPLLIHILAMVLTRRISRIYQILYSYLSNEGPVPIPPRYARELEVDLIRRVFQKIRAMQAIEKIEELIQTGSRQNPSGYSEEYDSKELDSERPESSRSLRKSQFTFFLGMTGFYLLVLLSSYYASFVQDQDMAKQHWEQTLRERDRILSQIDHLPKDPIDRNRIRSIQAALRPYLTILESNLMNPGLEHILSHTKLPFPASSSIILSKKQKKIYFEGVDFQEELGRNWKRMYLLGIRHGDTYFHKFSTPLYSYALNASDFLKSRNQFEVVSNAGTHFLKYFFQTGDHALLLLVKLNSLSSEELKTALILSLIQPMKEVSFSYVDHFQWVSHTITRGSHPYGIRYRASPVSFQQFFKDLQWLHLIFVILLISLYLFGGVSLLKFRREAMFLFFSFAFLFLVFYLGFLFEGIRRSTPNVRNQTQFFKEREELLKKIRVSLKESVEDFKLQLNNWAHSSPVRQFPFQDHGGYLLLSNHQILNQSYNGLSAMESRLLIALSLHYMGEGDRGSQWKDYPRFRPPDLPWTLKHLDRKKNLTKLSADFLEKYPSPQKIPFSILSTRAGPMLLWFHRFHDGKKDRFIAAAIPRRSLGECLGLSQNFQEDLNSLVSEFPISLGIFDQEISSYIYSHGWEEIPGEGKAFLNSPNTDSAYKRVNSQDTWMYEISNSDVSDQFHIAIAWKRIQPASGKSKGFISISPALSLLFLAGFAIILAMGKSILRPLEFIKTAFQNLILGHPAPEFSIQTYARRDPALEKLNSFLESLTDRKLPPLPHPTLIELVENNPWVGASRSLNTPLLDVQFSLPKKLVKPDIHDAVMDLKTFINPFLELVNNHSGILVQKKEPGFQILFPKGPLHQGAQAGIELGLKMLESFQNFKSQALTCESYFIDVAVLQGKIQLDYQPGESRNHITLSGEILKESRKVFEEEKALQRGVLIPKALASRFEFSYDLTPVTPQKEFFEIRPSTAKRNGMSSDETN